MLWRSWYAALAVGAVVAFAGDAGADRACAGFPPVAVFDRRGSDDRARWVPVRSPRHLFADVRDVVLESAVARVTYEPLTLVEQAGSHSLYVKRGKDWLRLTSPEYGDYTYWVSTLVQPAVAVTVERGAELTSARFRYLHAGGTIVLDKTIALDRCSPGMFVRFQSDPMNPTGEREIGIGRPLPIAFSPTALAVHPGANQHIYMNLAASAAPYWAAASWSGEALLALLVLARPDPVYSYQFDPRQNGYLTVNQLTEEARDADRFQAFVGATPYDSAGASVALAAPSPEGLAAASVVAPADGEYMVWIHGTAIAEEVVLSIDGVAYALTVPPAPSIQQLYLPRVALRAGAHLVEVAGPAERVVLLPLDGNDDFPAAVARRVQATLAGSRK